MQIKHKNHYHSQIHHEWAKENKRANISNPYIDLSYVAWFLLTKWPISVSDPSLKNIIKHNGGNLVCFDEQIPRLADVNNG